MFDDEIDFDQLFHIPITPLQVGILTRHIIYTKYDTLPTNVSSMIPQFAVPRIFTV